MAPPAPSRDHLPPPMGNTLPKAAQDAAGLLYHNNALPAHGQLLVHQDQGLLCRTAFWSLGPQPVLVQGLIPRYPQMQDLAFPCVELDEIPLCPACQGPSPWQHNPLTHQPFLRGFFIIYKLAMGALCPTIQVINEDVEHTGTSTGPWGMPLLTGLQWDLALLIISLWAWPFRQFSIHLTAHLSNPHCQLSTRMLWETESKTLSRSRLTTSTGLPTCTKLVTSL